MAEEKKKSVFYKTNVHGLDVLLRDGLKIPCLETENIENGMLMLIKGVSGTGKTTLALQIASGALEWEISEGNEVWYFSCEQDASEISKKCGELGIIDNGESNQPLGEKNYIRIQALNTVHAASAETPYNPEQMLDRANEIHEKLSFVMEEKRLRLVVVDGLNTLSRKERRLFEIQSLLNLLRKKSMVSVVVFEEKESMYDVLDYLADIVIELRGEEVAIDGGSQKYFLNQIHIVKSRFQQNVLGWHQYKIRSPHEKKDLELLNAKGVSAGSAGLEVFPSLHFRVHKSPGHVFMEMMASINPITVPKSSDFKDIEDRSIITYILNNAGARKAFKEGSSTVVLGQRSTLKTQLTLDFLRGGSEKEGQKSESGLLLSFMDNPGTIADERESLCKMYCLSKKKAHCEECKDCYKNVHLFHLRPGCISPAEFFDKLEMRLDIARIRRAVFWDLTQIEYRFPFFKQDSLFLPALMDYLKNSMDSSEKPRCITSVFMGSLDTPLAEVASNIADNVLFCWQENQGNSQNIKSGWIVVYIDRLEGHPSFSEGSFFIVERGGSAKYKLDDLIEKVKDKDVQFYRESLEKIRLYFKPQDS